MNIVLNSIINFSKELISIIFSIGEKVLNDLLGDGVVNKIMSN